MNLFFHHLGFFFCLIVPCPDHCLFFPTFSLSSVSFHVVFRCSIALIISRMAKEIARSCLTNGMSLGLTKESCHGNPKGTHSKVHVLRYLEIRMALSHTVFILLYQLDGTDNVKQPYTDCLVYKQGNHIRKTCPCNEHPSKPRFYRQ